MVVTKQIKATKADNKTSSGSAKDKKTQLQQDKSYVGQRVAKDFDGTIYEGTVSKFLPNDRLWKINYDDGDQEDLELDELKNAVDLHNKKNINHKKGSATTIKGKGKGTTKKKENGNIGGSPPSKKMKVEDEEEKEGGGGSPPGEKMKVDDEEEKEGGGGSPPSEKTKADDEEEGKEGGGGSPPSEKMKADKAKKSQLQQDKSYVGQRVSKNFDGAIYEGIVSKFLPNGRVWKINYDDGDKEDLEFGELKIALDLHHKKNLKNHKGSTKTMKGKGKGATK